MSGKLNSSPGISSSEEDPELISVFSLTDSEDESDEEFYPLSLSGRLLREVENPYDKAVRIQQANRELFTQPATRKKQTTRVKFHPLPRLVDDEGSGETVSAQRVQRESKEQHLRRTDSYHRRKTPMVISRDQSPPQVTDPPPASPTAPPPAPRLTKSPDPPPPPRPRHQPPN